MNKSRILFLFAFIIPFSLFASTYKVADISEFKEKVKHAVAGDSIVLRNGVWKDAQLVFKGNGENGKCISLVAETQGKVFLQGKSCLNLSGDYLFVSGLVFNNGYSPKGVVIDFRTSSKEYAYNCVVSECVIDRYNQPVKDSADHWVCFWGKMNKVEYCYLGGKTNVGTTMVVWPNDSNSTNNGHLIYRNYFGTRPRLGSNGGESIRIGTSTVCTNSSKTIVDGNYFERCNGEVEVISNKSCDNIFVNNTFLECEGNLVLRHGNNATVAGNWFIGNGKEYTGGVRIINEGHKIYNNFFYKLRGDGFRSPITIMNAIPNSPPSGYAPVKNVIVANNTFFDCSTPWAFCVGVEERNRIVRPENVLLLNNLVYCPNSAELIKSYDNTDGIIQDNNLMIGANGMSTDKGTVAGEIVNSSVWGIDYIYSVLKAKRLPFVKYDILGQKRDDATIGAFQGNSEKPLVEMATSRNCGPSWYQPQAALPKKKVTTKGNEIRVSAGVDLLNQAIKTAKAGDILVLDEGEHIITKKIVLAKDITIRAAIEAASRPVIKAKYERTNGNLFEISGDAVIHLARIALNGDSKSRFPAKYAITTAKESAVGYSVFLTNCEIYDFNEETGAILKGYKGSMADSIKISNSIIRDSYRGFSLGEEKDDLGKYSAENLVFDNTVFNNIQQYVVDYYRGGNDESTLGGSFAVNHCVFSAVANDEKQTIFKLTGIVNVNIANSIFSKSMAQTSFKLYGAKNHISNCCISDCAMPQIGKGAVVSNLRTDNPIFEKDKFTLSKKSTFLGKASDGSNIGLSK
ncbi:MAG: polysaccharide lyase 6 family protein [Bacteroidales bacterium]